jgi:hypothetical protein
MNDFTKEELELILGDLDHAVFSRFYGEEKQELRTKIKSMIDGYCDHAWAFYLSPHGNAVRCHKCNMGIP